MCANSVTKRKLDDTDSISFVGRTVLALNKESKLIVVCFEKCGFLSGYNDLFNSGIQFRDLNLPKETEAYNHEVVSFETYLLH